MQYLVALGVEAADCNQLGMGGYKVVMQIVIKKNIQGKLIAVNFTISRLYHEEGSPQG